MGISWRLAVAGLATAGVLGCSSSQTVQGPGGTGPTGTVDKGVDPGTGQEPGAGTDKNPYGVAYPTTNVGYQARKGTTPGNIIKNYKFLGHRGDTGQLITLSMADFFDPQVKQYKIIRFLASARWCNPCVQETKAMLPLLPELKDKKVLVIQAITDGLIQGKGATPSDLLAWIKTFPIPTADLPVMLDPEVKNLGQFFDAAAIPWNGVIDARSMEILESGVGYNPKIMEEVDRWVSWVDANPPQQVQ